MEIRIKRDKLSEELACLSGAIEKKAHIPILETVKLDTGAGNILSLGATDLENAITTEVQAEQVVTHGKVCVPYRKLSDAVKLMPEGTLLLSTEENGWLRVRGKGTNLRFAGFDATNYPTLPDSSELDWINVPAKHLKTLIAAVSFSIPGPHAQVTLQGAQMIIDGSTIKMVATDGARLSWASGPLSTMLADDITVLVPTKGLTEAQKLVQGREGAVGVAKTDNTLFFRIGNRQVACALLSAKFPGYQDIFNSQKNFKGETTFRADVLAQSLHRAMFGAELKTPKISLSFAGNKLVMKAQDADSNAEAEEVMETDWKGKEQKVWLNARYLLDFLDSVEAVKVKLQVVNEDTQLYFEAKPGGIDVRYVLMPMRG